MTHVLSMQGYWKPRSFLSCGAGLYQGFNLESQHLIGDLQYF